MATRDVSGNVIGGSTTPSGTASVKINPPKIVNGMPDLSTFSEYGTKLGDLDTMLWQYTQGLVTNVQAAKQSGGLLNNPETISALNSITADIPGAGAAMQLAGKLKDAINSTFGVGSVVGRFVSAFVDNPITGGIEAIKSLFTGRTWRYDQYQLATLYSFYILGKDIGDTTHASDALVVEACKYFIDRLGVFINGARTLMAFINPLQDGVPTNRKGSPMEYMILVNENPFVTIDQERVNAAFQVTQTYMPWNHVLGGWRNTIGVYDRELVSLAQQGYSNYYGNLASLKQQAASGNDSVLNSTGSGSSINIYLYAVIAIAVIFIIIIIAKK